MLTTTERKRQAGQHVSVALMHQVLGAKFMSKRSWHHHAWMCARSKHYLLFLGSGCHSGLVSTDHVVTRIPLHILQNATHPTLNYRRQSFECGSTTSLFQLSMACESRTVHAIGGRLQSDFSLQSPLIDRRSDSLQSSVFA